MNAWRQDDPRAEDYQGPELDEAVSARIAEMSYSQLRDHCDTYRSYKRVYGHKPFGFSFGEWLRDQVAQALLGRATTLQFIQTVQPILDRYVRGMS